MAKKVAKRIGDEAVKAKTGKVWKEWFKILDAAGAKKMTHTEIARHLYGKCKVPGWWSQMVANQYEQERGLRAARQDTNGNFAAGVSRIVNAPLAKLYKSWADEKARRAWLKNVRLEITTATKNKSIRAEWDDATRLSVMFYAKGAAKSQIVIDHMKLPSAAESKRMKDFWMQAVERAQELLER